MNQNLLFNILGLIIGFGGIVFGVLQSSRIANIRKIVNDYVKGLYRDSQRILQLAIKEQDLQAIVERGIAIKYSVIRLDIINRNLNAKRIDTLKENGILTEDEAKEYKHLSSTHFPH
ncbi:MAG: hypothetical protein ACYDIA_11235 [Candidatus Humimicrobiaceae bacterium]